MTVYRCPLIIGGSLVHSTAGDNYLCCATSQLSSAAINATEANRAVKFYTDGWFSNLRCYVGANSDANNEVITLRINGSDTALTTTVTAGATGLFEDSTNVVSFANGDTVTIEINKVDGLNSVSYIYFAVDMLVATAYNKIAQAGVVNLSTANTTRYFYPTGTATTSTSETDDYKTQVPAALTAKKFQAYVSANARSTTTTYHVRQNGADSGISVSFAAGVTGFAEDTTNTASFSAADDINYSGVTLGGGSAITTQFIACDIECSTAGDFPAIGGSNVSTISTNQTRYQRPIGGLTGGLNATETQRDVHLNGSGTIQDLRTTIVTNSAANSTVFTMRKNTADTAITFTVNATTTGDHSDLTNSFTWADGDEISMKLSRASGSSGTLSTNWYSFLMSIDGESDPGGGASGNPWYAYAMQ